MHTVLLRSYQFPKYRRMEDPTSLTGAPEINLKVNRETLQFFANKARVD
jgi:hypothetical protein